MALVNCPNCGKKISENSFSCLHCGFTIRERMVQKTTKDTEEDFVQEHLMRSGKPSSTKDYSFRILALISIVLGVVIWVIELFNILMTLFTYPELTEELGNNMMGWSILGGSLVLVGFFILFYEKFCEFVELQKKIDFKA